MDIRHETIAVGKQLVSYTHYYSESSQVCFLLSGASYVYNHPYFYYSRMMLLNHDVNIIEIHYMSDDIYELPDEEADDEILRRIDAVIAKVLQEKTYLTHQFIAKSLGTGPLVTLMQRPVFSEATVILLTPLLTVPFIAEGIAASRQRGLLVIGDADRFHETSAIERCRTSHLTVELIPGANHSLDIGFQVDQSLATVAHVTKRIEETLFPVTVIR